MTTATMATTPGRAQYAVKAFGSLVGQADYLHLYFNGDEHEMSWETGRDLIDMGVRIHFATNGDLADLGKFYPPAPGVRITVDDDLIYPPDYVATLLDGLKRYPGCIVTFHGVDVHPQPQSYYRNRNVYRCLGTVEEDRPVMVGGSGVMAFPDGVQIWYADPWPFMADLVVARWAREHGFKIWVLAHAEGWIRHQEIDHRETIYTRFARSDEFQTWFVRRYIV